MVIKWCCNKDNKKPFDIETSSLPNRLSNVA